MIKLSKNIVKEIKRAQSIAIFTHTSPDFDALGSSLTVCEMAKAMGKNAVVFVKDKLSENQSMLFGKDCFSNEDCDFASYDLLISTDCPSLDRLGSYAKGFEKHQNTFVIDHHKSGGLVGKFNLLCPNYSSCCEIIFEILKVLKVKISPQMASYLYAGLSSDTNSFINLNVTQASFDNASKLLALGADCNSVNEKLYKNKTKKEVEFKKYLWSNFKIEKDVAYCVMDNQTLTKMKGQKYNCSNFSSELLSIQGVNYSFSIVEEKKGYFNLSLRSKMGYAVLPVAQSFGGGGHLYAAGAQFKENSINDALTKVLKILRKK